MRLKDSDLYRAIRQLGNSQSRFLYRFALVAVIAISACTSPPNVTAVKAAMTSVESTITTISSGTVAANEQAVLNFGIVGRISEVSVRAGDKVKRGQQLAALENADLRVSAQAARSELSRTQDLAKEGLVSKAALDEAKRANEVAQATFERSTITAPFDGLITEVNLRKGEIAQMQIGADKPPIRLIDLKPRLVKGDIDEMDLGKVKKGLDAVIKIPALENRKFKATVTNVVPFVSSNREQDRTSQIELRFADSEELIPVGASADVEIFVTKKADALTVPARAVLGTAKQHYVFRLSGNRVERADVDIGIGNYERREILSGIKAGDVVVLPSEEYDLKTNDKVKVSLQPWP